MKKVIFIVLGLVVISVAALYVMRQQTKKHSPADTAMYQKDGLDITVKYCRPYKKDRLIFGDAAQGALQPYRTYWRVGANEATVIEFNQDVIFGGKELKAGKYNLYAYPNRDTWDIVLGNDWDRWGYNEPAAADEVLRVKAPVNNNAPEQEQFLISFDEDASLVLHWDKIQLRIPIERVES